MARFVTRPQARGDQAALKVAQPDSPRFQAGEIR
jgi:hypothetical protein